MAILSRDMFLEIREELEGKKAELVEIAPGIEVRVVQITADAGYALSNMLEREASNDGRINTEDTFRWVAACCRGEDGEQVFTPEDLGKLPMRTVQDLVAAVNRVNDLANPVAIEDAEKNSEVAIS